MLACSVIDRVDDNIGVAAFLVGYLITYTDDLKQAIINVDEIARSGGV